jgi:ATP-binding cassette subfamily F protein 3
MRAALAAAIFVDPNLLLLDEPTNHLDLHALVWLEDWLVNKFAGILVVVSHDQFFLDSVCTDVLEMRSPLAGASKSSLEHFSGDYRTYERTLHEKRLNLGRSREAVEKEREKLQEFISREGKKYDNPAHQAQKKMKMKQLAALEEVEIQEDDAELVLRLPSPHGHFDSLERLISVQDVGFAWPQAGQEEVWKQLQLQRQLPPQQQQQLTVKYCPPLFKQVDFVIQPRARIAIVGRNGCGKTSLLNILMGECDPTEGSVHTHPGCRVCMLQQHHYKGEQLDPDKTPLEHIRALPQDASTAVGLHDPGTRQEESAQRSYLANFGIRRTPAVLPVKYLSGGQRMRVALAVALFRKPDLLVLDEPTNHLDGDTVRALCEALESFEGAIIAVSHDEAFVNRVIASAGQGQGQGHGSEKDDDDKDGGVSKLGGDILVMSKQKVVRFQGAFREYKQMIRAQVAAGKEHNDV